MSDYREVDRQVSWKQNGKVYIKETVLVERIPIVDVPTCLYCGDPMFEAREGQKYCQENHRIAAHRLQKQRQGNG